MQNNLNYSLHCYNLEDSASAIEIAYREEIRRYTGHDFGYSRQIYLLKASVTELEETIKNAIRDLSEKFSGRYGEPRQLDLGVTGTEFALGDGVILDTNFPMRSGDVVKVLVSYNHDSQFGEFTDVDRANCLMYSVHVMGYKPIADALASKLRDDLSNLNSSTKSALVKWVFQSNDGISSRIFKIYKNWEIDSLYYPWIKTKTLSEYYDAFFKSNSQILLTYGPPGTGKTSFIRDLVYESGKNTVISYDSSVLTSDSTFVRYITDPHFDVIVIEDADELLTSERDELNKVVSKILNISDGLIKLPKKKLIFSTNLPTLNDVDPALLRPGRCFDAIEFGKLTRDQAQKIATKFNCKLPDSDKFTLGEIFFENDLKRDSVATVNHEKRIHKMGF